MFTLSLAMIVKNESEVLARCLDSVKDIVDEIIVVDTGSTDDTCQIAESFGAQVYHFEWINDFSAARNFSFSKTTGDYIIWLDADDFLTDIDQQLLIKYKKSFDGTVDVYFMPYVLSRDEFGNVTFKSTRERILKRERNFQWTEPVHEVITPSGKLIELTCAVTHGEKNRTHVKRNLDIFEKQESLTTRGTFYYARELHNHNRYDDAIEQFTKFLSTERGWIEDNINACFDLYDCYSKTDRRDRGLDYLFYSFKFDKPRAKTCCFIGNYYFDKNDYMCAIFWYELALNAHTHRETGFFQRDFVQFIPAIQLCVIHSRKKDYNLAYEYHLLTKSLKPEHKSVKYNQEYFDKLIEQGEMLL